MHVKIEYDLLKDFGYEPHVEKGGLIIEFPPLTEQELQAVRNLQHEFNISNKKLEVLIKEIRIDLFIKELLDLLA